MQQAPVIAADASAWWHWGVGFVALVLVLGYAIWDGGERASASFYETAAQILPVLIVALAVEQRIRDDWDTLAWRFVPRSSAPY